MSSIVLVREIKNMKSGISKQGKPYNKTFFIGTVDEGVDLPISTFDKVEPNKCYEMELTDEEYEGKTYHKASVKSEFVKEPPKTPPAPPKQPISTEKGNEFIVDAYRIAILFLEKSNTSITLKDLNDTAREIHNGMKGLK